MTVKPHAVQLAPDLFWQLHRCADDAGMSLQGWLTVVLQDYCHAHPRATETPDAKRWHAPKCPCPACGVQRRRLGPGPSRR